ncbi:hypothetical protein FA09DRAFT_362525 [Tilletiopsis washingtonensis]|uniref:Uncharacterized protein n=1 Tax=Tilletiopsis washingtonensis TaxID=58919 RepID=A0A316Z2T9_9BASI|nr:hypothetical protein FA09DRAFT_362525 [Tilletiopsis washingtonensis]PWN95851.1 hypothetical protein FA09DRAFT_362525 [Tilletiopsis washingtonensis]
MEPLASGDGDQHAVAEAAAAARAGHSRSPGHFQDTDSRPGSGTRKAAPGAASELLHARTPFLMQPRAAATRNVPQRGPSAATHLRPAARQYWCETRRCSASPVGVRARPTPPPAWELVVGTQRRRWTRLGRTDAACHVTLAQRCVIRFSTWTLAPPAPRPPRPSTHLLASAPPPHTSNHV